MRSKFTFLFPLLSLVLVFALISSSANAQIRKRGGGKKRSWYFSGGSNMAWYNPTTIHVQQPTLGNNYDLTNVTGDNKSLTKSISPMLLNYRIGWYFNYNQTAGFELSFDPVVYHIKDGETVQLKGTFDDIANVNKSLVFASKNNYYYYLNGSNLILLNFVRRFTIYRPVSNKIGIDFLAKGGIGPAMPEVTSNLGGKTLVSPQMQFAGFNTGLEAAIRTTFFRYGYIELAAKYDYAMLSNLPVYEGTTSHNLGTMEVIGSIGFTFPTHRYNPLFYKPHKIITILPLYTLRSTKEKGKGWKKKSEIDYSESKKEQKKAKGDKNKDSEEIEDIPEFSEITDKIQRKQMLDSMRKQAVEDSIYKSEHPTDTTQVVPDNTENTGKKHKRNRHKDAEVQTDSAQNQAQAIDTTGAAPVKDKVEDKDKGEKKENVQPAENAEKKDTAEMSKKDLKKQEKQKKKDEKKKAKEDKKLEKEKEKAEKEKQKQEEKDKAEKEKKDKEDQEKKDKQDREEKSGEEK